MKERFYQGLGFNMVHDDMRYVFSRCVMVITSGNILQSVIYLKNQITSVHMASI